MKLKRLILVIIFLFPVLLLTGCWDAAELQDLDIVSAVGIDAGSDEVENRYLVTVQIINEGQIAGGSGKGGSTGEAAPVTTLSATGSTISEALRKISPKSPNELFFPHVQLLVIGEELARKQGIQDLFDWIERDPEFRTLFPILIVRENKAQTILQITTPLEPIPAAKIFGGLETTKKIWGEYATTRADQVIQQLNGQGANLTGVQINGEPEKGNDMSNIQKISPNTEIEIRGLAIFNKGKLVKWLDGDAARGATWVNNEMKKTVINLDCNEEKNSIAINIMRSKAKLKAKIINGKPVIYITVRAEGHISEVHCAIDLGKNKIIEKVK